MPTPTTPGVYIEETGRTTRSIAAEPMHVAAFVGELDDGPVGTPVQIISIGDFVATFGAVSRVRPTATAIELFFRNGGTIAWVVRVPAGPDAIIDALDGLIEHGRPAVILAPDCSTLGRGDGARVHQALIAAARSARAMAILDVDDHAASSRQAMIAWRSSAPNDPDAVVYFPRLKLNDSTLASPGGAAAGLWARTDATHGVWKAPAGQHAAIGGGAGLSPSVTNAERGLLNPLAINTLIDTPLRLWGARTLAGADNLGSERKYISVQRTASMIERSILRSCQWTLFEPNGEPLWAQLRLAVGAFMQTLFVQGAFQGTTPREAYFVKCGADTTTARDIAAGAVHVLVGFAPLKPAEFVLLDIELRALAA